MVVIHLQFWAYGSWDSLFPISMSPSQLQTYESRTLFLMTSLQYHCILGLAEKNFASQRQNCAKDAGCAGNKITDMDIKDSWAHQIFKGPIKISNGPSKFGNLNGVWAIGPF